jgi:hypothetical protein
MCAFPAVAGRAFVLRIEPGQKSTCLVPSGFNPRRHVGSNASGLAACAR